MSTLIEESKKPWVGNGTLESINAGSLQRIANACELMAQNYLKLQEQAHWANQSKEYWESEATRMRHKNKALRGVITKLKKKGQP